MLHNRGNAGNTVETEPWDVDDLGCRVNPWHPGDGVLNDVLERAVSHELRRRADYWRPERWRLRITRLGEPRVNEVWQDRPQGPGLPGPVELDHRVSVAPEQDVNHHDLAEHAR